MKKSKKNNTNYRIIAAVGLVVISFVVLFNFATLNKNESNPATEQIEIINRSLSIGDNVTISIEVADTPERTTLGLSYRETLPENHGMLFVFEYTHIPTFWMKGMNFPLDMIWIGEDNTIVDITQNVPHPSPGTMEFELPHYSPTVPAKMVLEVNAGFVEKNGIEVGDSIELLKD